MQLVHDYDSFKKLLNTELFIYNSYYDYIVFENYVISISDNTETAFNIYTYSDYEGVRYFSIQNYRLTELYLIVENKCLMNITENQNISETRTLLESLSRKRKLERILDGK